ncbi:MAG: hypothetical protein RBS39_07200 [Phycisphaerales bacterium]|jgi:hypothetical protein|nr:hypothetical protein [Phycisphaerales bacterium]
MTKTGMEVHVTILTHWFYVQPCEDEIEFAIDAGGGILYRSVSERYVNACGQSYVARRLRQCAAAEENLVRSTRARDPYWDELDHGERSAVLKLLRTVGPRDLASADRERFTRRREAGAALARKGSDPPAAS